MYAADASAPTMDTSDSVGWFIVDMRDLAGQRQQERWVKLQGASPGEVLISSSLAMARVSNDPGRTQARDGASHPASPEAGDTASRPVREEAVVDEVSVPVAAALAAASPSPVKAANRPLAEAEPEVRRSPGGVAVVATSTAAAVSDLDALPVGPGADGMEARTFSLSISVKGAAGLSRLAPSLEGAGGGGFWFSYSIFGVVVQTDRFERLAPPPPGDGPVLEPMLDSFRLRATLQGLCAFLGEAPPLQVRWNCCGAGVGCCRAEYVCVLSRGIACQCQLVHCGCACKTGSRHPISRLVY